MDKLKKKPYFSQDLSSSRLGVSKNLRDLDLSPCKMSQDQANINKLKNICLQLNQLKSTKATKPVTYSRRNDPWSWLVPPSPPESRPSWIYAENRPLITFTSSVNMIPIFSFRRLKNELKNPSPEREFYQQGTDKWYKGYPISCFYQATCPPLNTTGTTICHCCARPLH